MYESMNLCLRYGYAAFHILNNLNRRWLPATMSQIIADHLRALRPVSEMEMTRPHTRFGADN
jgi:hypothetical protein